MDNDNINSKKEAEETDKKSKIKLINDTIMKFIELLDINNIANFLKNFSSSETHCGLAILLNEKLDEGQSDLVKLKKIRKILNDLVELSKTKICSSVMTSDEKFPYEIIVNSFDIKEKISKGISDNDAINIGEHFIISSIGSLSSHFNMIKEKQKNHGLDFIIKDIEKDFFEIKEKQKNDILKTIGSIHIPELQEGIGYIMKSIENLFDSMTEVIQLTNTEEKIAEIISDATKIYPEIGFMAISDASTGNNAQRIIDNIELISTLIGARDVITKISEKKDCYLNKQIVKVIDTIVFTSIIGMGENYVKSAPTLEKVIVNSIDKIKDSLNEVSSMSERSFLSMNKGFNDEKDKQEKIEAFNFLIRLLKKSNITK